MVRLYSVCLSIAYIARPRHPYIESTESPIVHVHPHTNTPLPRYLCLPMAVLLFASLASQTYKPMHRADRFEYIYVPRALYWKVPVRYSRMPHPVVVVMGVTLSLPEIRQLRGWFLRGCCTLPSTADFCLLGKAPSQLFYSSFKVFMQ